MQNSVKDIAHSLCLVLLAGSGSASAEEANRTKITQILESPLPYIPTQFTIIREIDGKIFTEENTDGFGLDPRVSRALYEEFDEEFRRRWQGDPRAGVPECGDALSTEDIIKYILCIFINSGGVLHTTATQKIENGTVILKVDTSHFSSYIYRYLKAKYPHMDTPILVNFLTIIGPISLCEDTFTDSTGKTYTLTSTLDNEDYIQWFEEVFQKMKHLYTCIKNGGILSEEFGCHWYSLQESIESGLVQFYTSTPHNPTHPLN